MIPNWLALTICVVVSAVFGYALVRALKERPRL